MDTYIQARQAVDMVVVTFINIPLLSYVRQFTKYKLETYVVIGNFVPLGYEVYTSFVVINHKNSQWYGVFYFRYNQLYSSTKSIIKSGIFRFSIPLSLTITLSRFKLF